MDMLALKGMNQWKNHEQFGQSNHIDSLQTDDTATQLMSTAMSRWFVIISNINYDVLLASFFNVNLSVPIYKISPPKDLITIWAAEMFP